MQPIGSRKFNFFFAAVLLGACCLSVGCGSRQPQRANAFVGADAPDMGWPSVRGPHLSGHSDEVHLADAWPDEGPPELWRRTLGQGYSSCVAVNGRVWTQYQDLAGQYVLCLDADSGATLWQYRYGDAYESSGMYPGPRSTPTIFDGRVYFSTPDAAVGCLDERGNELWTVDLKSQFGSRGTEFGYACSPTVAYGKVLLPLGGKDAAMVALDQRTGELLWRSGDDAASYVPALPIEVGDQIQVVGLMQHAVIGYDLDDGDELWRVELSHGYDEHSAWPIYDNGLLWIASPFQSGCELFRLNPDETPAIESVYHSETMSNDVVSSVLIKGSVFGFDLKEAQSKVRRPSRGSFRSIDLKTGDVNWSNGDPKKRRSDDYQASLETQTIGHASVVVADGKLYFLSDTGDLIVAKAASDQYIELGRTRLLSGQTSWTTPAIAGGRLFARNHSEVVAVFIGDPDHFGPPPSAMMGLRNISLRRLLGVRADDTTRAPSRNKLINWFGATFASLAAALAIAGLFCLVIPTMRTAVRFRSLSALLGVSFCLIAGPLASHASNQFLFTLPGVLLVGFLAGLYRMKLRREDTTSSATVDRAVAVLFVVICVGYFVVCKRVALVSGWLFLCGFVGAVPGGLAARLVVQKHGKLFRLAEAAGWLVALVGFWVSSAWLIDVVFGAAVMD